MLEYFVPADSQIKHPDSVYIDGKWRKPVRQSVLKVINPTTEMLIAQVAEAHEEEMDVAVAAARKAFDDGPWPRMTIAQRIEIVRSLANALRARHAEIARVQTMEMGAPIWLGHAFDVGAPFDNACDYAAKFKFVETFERGSGAAVIAKEPVGVVAAITPWNAPLGLAAAKLGPALVAGCTVILKSSPETPLDGLVLAECADAVGIPPGVLNIVAADRPASEHLVRNPRVDKVAFTGSTAAGKKIASICGERVARCTLELGGKSAAIILDDIAIEDVVKTLVIASILNNGQACAGLTRALISRHRHDEFAQAMATAYQAIRVGDPLEMETQLGPMAMKRQQDRVLGYIEKGKAEGATLVTGGGVPAHLTSGYFVEPTVFANATNQMTIAREEIFGPVITIIPYDTVEDAIRIANDSDYGLNGAVYTNDSQLAYDIARRIRAGNFSQNEWTFDAKFPFGGFKQSGLGRENGAEGLAPYLETKTIYMPVLPVLPVLPAVAEGAQ